MNYLFVQLVLAAPFAVWHQWRRFRAAEAVEWQANEIWLASLKREP